MSIERCRRLVRRGVLASGLIIASVVAGSCGGSTGGIPSGIAAGVLNVRISSSFVTASASTTPTSSSVSLGAIQDLSGQAQSALLVLKGAAPDGTDVQQRYTFGLKPASPPTGAGGYGVQIYQGALKSSPSTPVYVVGYPDPTAASPTSFAPVYSSVANGVASYGYLSPHPTKYIVGNASGNLVGAPTALPNTLSYGYQMPAQVLRAGTFDGIVYLFSTQVPATETTITPPPAAPGPNTPVLGVVLRVTVTTGSNGTQIDVTDPANSTLEYGTFRALTFSMPDIANAITGSGAINAAVKASYLRIVVGIPGSTPINGISPTSTYTTPVSGLSTSNNTLTTPGLDSNNNVIVTYLDRGATYSVYADLFYDGTYTQVYAGAKIAPYSYAIQATSLPLGNEVSSITQINPPTLSYNATTPSAGAQSILLGFAAKDSLGNAAQPYTVAPGATGISTLITYPAATAFFPSNGPPNTLPVYLGGSNGSYYLNIFATSTLNFPVSPITAVTATYQGIAGSSNVVTSGDITLQALPVGSDETATVPIYNIPPSAQSVLVQLSSATGPSAFTGITNITPPTTPPTNGSASTLSASVHYIDRGGSLSGTAYLYSAPNAQGILLATVPIPTWTPSYGTVPSPSLAVTDSTLTLLNATIDPVYPDGTTTDAPTIGVGGTVLANYELQFGAAAPYTYVTIPSTVLSYPGSIGTGITLTETGSTNSYTASGTSTSTVTDTITPSFTYYDSSNGNALTTTALSTSYSVSINPNLGSGTITINDRPRGKGGH